MAGHPLIGRYLRQLSDRLPADTVDELADGLHETWTHFLERGDDAEAAARAAIAEFGTPAQVVDAFVADAPGRRTARALLATGPLVGACWAACLIEARAWTWPIPTGVRAGYAAAVVTVVICLLIAASSRHGYRRTRLGDVGAAALVPLDLVMIAAVALAGSTFVWPVIVAVPASVIRILLITRALPGRAAR
ncbi:HAAS signaling domain-containing protein [Cryptosporangium arvum]|uniref:Uncharacterized protein n=1 Tax=Cryptosporangium arvum DSM 44712 TaxID=927661 RepID=A0A010YQK3_9ACTN|nr:hypothetical protein [Cryptosporangium arvum]EXG82475.1 hypothetical protein CryarDRAFT_3663 [Cryptosporangium arvum DSM 44712]